jgi:hypothetical protein
VSVGNDVDKAFRDEIDGDVLVDVRKQRSIRLNSSTNIQDRERLIRKTFNPPGQY